VTFNCVYGTYVMCNPLVISIASGCVNMNGLMNNNSVQLFILYVWSQQLHDQLQTQHNAIIGNYILDSHNIKSGVNYRNTIMQKQTNKQIETITNINCKQNIKIARQKYCKCNIIQSN
jgi:hypothetical protein